MTHQEESAVLEAVTSIMIEHGPAAMASACSIIMNCAMQIEREQALKAESHQRTADRQGYANGFKPKTLRTRVGEVHLRIPQTRDYHDDEGRPFYPKSLDRGVRSERAMTLAVAEMYVQGVSTRKVTKIVRVEDSPDVFRSVRLHRNPGDVGECVLDGVELAPLPGHSGHGRMPGGLES